METTTVSTTPARPQRIQIVVGLMLHHLPPVMGATNRGPISNPTYQPPLEQKPMHPGHYRHETCPSGRRAFAEPTYCSANIHCS
jgi:hypothetical protein